MLLVVHPGLACAFMWHKHGIARVTRHSCTEDTARGHPVRELVGTETQPGHHSHQARCPGERWHPPGHLASFSNFTKMPYGLAVALENGEGGRSREQTREKGQWKE